MMQRSFTDALNVLETCRRVSRPQDSWTRDADRSSHRMALRDTDTNLRGKPNIVGMMVWLRLIGHNEDALASINAIHVAGTKGKGSTCAFVHAFLDAHHARTGYPGKIGRYSSPHLVCVTERIIIAGGPISKDLFAKYFFEVWDKINKSDLEYGRPRYLQLLALISFHVFICESVDVSIFETHCGGEFDATNVISKPIVTGITTIGKDHVLQLGPELQDIAWHKAGIFKPDVAAYSTLQEETVSSMLVERAFERGANLRFVDLDSTVFPNHRSLIPCVQRLNFSLALALAREFLDNRSRTRHDILTDHDVEQGLRLFVCPGRFEQISMGDVTWFLDGAHNEISAYAVAQWYESASTNIQSNNSALHGRILIFGQNSQARDPSAVLNCLAKALLAHQVQINQVVFSKSAGKTGRSHPSYSSFDTVWRSQFPDAAIWNVDTAEDAFNRALELAGHERTEILVTGSLALVGSILRQMKEKVGGVMQDFNPILGRTR